MQEENMEQSTISRLIAWLKAHGHSADDIVDCIDFITGGKNRKKDSKE